MKLTRPPPLLSLIVRPQEGASKMADAVPPRLRAYLDILGRGLVLLRNFTHLGNLELSCIEADHLHIIPRLIYEDHKYSHEHYIRNERGLYLQRLRKLGATEYIEQAGIWYSEPWLVLAGAAGVKLPAWDQEAEPGAAADGGGL